MSSSLLLQNYGFVEPGNPYDSVTVAAVPLTPDKYSEEKRHVLKLAGLPLCVLSFFSPRIDLRHCRLQVRPAVWEWAAPPQPPVQLSSGPPPRCPHADCTTGAAPLQQFHGQRLRGRGVQ